MAKNTNKARQESAAPRPVTPAKAESKAPAAPKKTLSVTAKLCLALLVITFVVYGNTLKNGYVLDDAMVCSKNNFVTQGFKGISDILTTPRMKGFAYLRNDNYRPLSLAMFAVTYQFAGGNPAAGHLVNILFFAGCVILLFLFLDKLFERKKTMVAFIAALLFAVHPVHTEVVANIKSLDEIMCFFFAFCALNIFLAYMRTAKLWQLLAGTAALFLSFIAKETIVTFLAIIPLIFFFYINDDRKRAILITAAAVVVTGAYLLIRAKVLNAYDANNTGAIEFIDNPLVNAPTIFVRIATAILILGNYMKLLFVPYPLNCDYCFNSIPYVTFGNIFVLLSLAIYLALVGVSIYRLFKKPKDPWAFGILFFLATMSLFTNIPFLMGTEMGDRFLFFASVGFCIVAALAVERWLANGVLTFDGIMKNTKVLAIVVPVVLIFSGLTFARNNDWSSNYSLYKADVPKSPNDCRLYFYLGDELAENMVPQETDTAKQRQMIQESIACLRRALEIYPEYVDAHTEMGKAYFLANNYDSAAVHLRRAMQLSPYQTIAANNLGTIYMRTGKYRDAIDLYKKALELKPDFTQALFNMGCCLLQLHQNDSALAYLNKTLEIEPSFTDAYLQIGTAYFFNNQFDKAEPYFKKALEINPNDLNALNNMGAVYLKTGKLQQGVDIFKKLISLNPNYVNAYSNMGQCYFLMKQYAAAIEILNKALSLDPHDVKDIPYIAMSFQGLGQMDQARKYEAIAKQYYSNFKLP